MTVLLVVLLALLAVYVVTAANGFSRQQALVEEAEAQVEVELRRRHDLVPALVAQVRAHEAHEQALLREVVAAHGAAVAGDARAEERLTRALRALPPPQTGPAQQLQAQLAETEDRIAAARRFHAGNVRALQVRLRTFPSALVGRALGVEPPDVEPLSDLERAELELPPEPR